MIDTPAFESNPDDGIDRTLTFAERNVFPALGLFAGAFVCHHNVFVILQSLKNKSTKRW